MAPVLEVLTGMIIVFLFVVVDVVYNKQTADYDDDEIFSFSPLIFSSDKVENDLN